jgi:hypothetical protein
MDDANIPLEEIYFYGVALEIEEVYRWDSTYLLSL